MSGASFAVARDWVGRPLPTLSGHGVILRPLAGSDLEGLFAVTPSETFRHYSVPPRMESVQAFVASMTTLLNDPTRAIFAVVLEETGRVIGSTSYLEIYPQHRGLEIGYTWYAPEHRGTRVNPACKLLMIAHAIDTLGAVRVQIKTGRTNLHSQRAIEKLGATYEGVLRANFIRPDGVIRDTVYYSVLPSEWPKVRAGLEARLSAAT
jgi:N-acetyltransferase